LDGPNIEDCIFESSGSGLSAQGGACTRIEGCYFEECYPVVIESSYGYGGTLLVRGCFFNKGGNGTIIQNAVISATPGAFILDGCTFNGFSVSSGDYLSVQGPTLGSIQMRGNISEDPPFRSLIGADDDQNLGGVDTYTNLATHSSFENTSQVSDVGNLTAEQVNKPGAGYIGNTAQQLAWSGGAASNSYAVFSNTAVNMNAGDVITVSFYAMASQNTQIWALWDGDADLGQFQIFLTTGWRRYVIRSLAAPYCGIVNCLYLAPGTNASVLIVTVDGVQVERNVRFPNPLVTTTTAPMMVTNSPNPTHPLAQGQSPSVGSFNPGWGVGISASVSGGDAAGIVSFGSPSSGQSPIPAANILFTVTLANQYQPPGANFVVMVAPFSGAEIQTVNGMFWGEPNSNGTFNVFCTAAFTPAPLTSYSFMFMTMGAGATR
jgi:hypothetical protein